MKRMTFTKDAFLGYMLDVRTLKACREDLDRIEVSFQKGIAEKVFGSPACLSFEYGSGESFIFTEKGPDHIICADVDEVNLAYLMGLFQACYRRSKVFSFPPIKEGGD